MITIDHDVIGMWTKKFGFYTVLLLDDFVWENGGSAAARDRLAALGRD